MKRPAMVYTWRDGLFVAQGLLVVLVALWLVFSAGGGAIDARGPAATGAEAKGAEESTGKSRDVPVEVIRRRIQMDQLSDQPARWAEPVEAPR